MIDLTFAAAMAQRMGLRHPGEGYVGSPLAVLSIRANSRVLKDRITTMASCSVDVTLYSSQSREFKLMNLPIVLSCQSC